VRDIDRALRYGELIPRRQRQMIEGFLTHADERTRAYAAHVIARDAEARREYARLRREDELAFEAMMVALDEGEPLSMPELDLSDDDLPF